MNEKRKKNTSDLIVVVVRGSTFGDQHFDLFYLIIISFDLHSPLSYLTAHHKKFNLD